MTQNMLYNQAVKESRQMDVDRSSEGVVTSRANFTVPQPGTVQVDVVPFASLSALPTQRFFFCISNVISRFYVIVRIFSIKDFS